MDVLYFATHDSELTRYGQSLNKLIDYMLAGKPIIGSYSGYPSMINEADCGSLVQAQSVEALTSELKKYAKLPLDERMRLGQRATDWILRHRQYSAIAKDFIAQLGY